MADLKGTSLVVGSTATGPETRSVKQDQVREFYWDRNIDSLLIAWDFGVAVSNASSERSATR